MIDFISVPSKRVVKKSVCSKWVDDKKRLRSPGLRCKSTWCLFILDNFWNAMVCFQPPNLLIRKVWVPVMHFCACPIHCKVYWWVGMRLGLCRLISEQPLIELAIRAFTIGSALWVLDVLLVYTDTVSVKPITAHYGGFLSE